MEGHSFFFVIQIALATTMLLCGIFIVSVKDVKPPTIYIAFYPFVGVLLCSANFLQTYLTPMYGKALWNPLHVIILLVVFPMFFSYVISLLRPGSIGRSYWIAAYLPVAALTALYFAFEALYGKLPLFARYDEMRYHLNMPQLWLLFFAVVLSACMVGLYTKQSVTLLLRHIRNFSSNFSNTEGNRLGWVWWAIAVNLIKWVAILMVIITEGYLAKIISLFIFILEMIILTILVIRQKNVYTEEVSVADDVSLKPATSPADNGASSELTPVKRQILKENLLVLLEKDEIYKDPDLSNEKVCNMLNTNHTYLWQVINRDMNTTFYQLINNCRLTQSTKLMKDPLHRKMSLRNIAEICGFKSLSAFSNLFKQTYGVSPTEWRDIHRNK